jgi:hypothetical protein
MGLSNMGALQVSAQRAVLSQRQRFQRHRRRRHSRFARSALITALWTALALSLLMFAMASCAFALKG